MKAISIFLMMGLLASTVWADSAKPQGASQEQLLEMEAFNFEQSLKDQLNPLRLRDSDQRRPFAEYERAGYLFFSDDDYRGTAEAIKETLAENLPEDVTLVVFTSSNSTSYQQRLFDQYNKYVKSEQLRIVRFSTNGYYFWARDGLPVPIWQKDSFGQEQLALVDARYYHGFEADRQVGQLFQAPVIELGYYFEGGNFIANSRGDCLVVQRVRPPSITRNIPDEALKSSYGCSRLVRLPFLKGIGHADEVVKFLSDDLVITDTPQYVRALEAEGFQVILFPEADLRYETYINSLQVNNVMFVPTFGESNDETVLKSYRDFGYEVVGIPTRALATRGQGGIHCITMTYPQVPFQRLLSDLSLVEIDVKR